MPAPALLTVCSKIGGALSKHIYRDADGRLVRDGSRCKMSRGRATVVVVDSAMALARVIDGLNGHQALTLGVIKGAGEGETREIAAKQLRRGSEVARSLEFFSFVPSAPAWVLFDIDGVDAATALEAIEAVVPAVRHAAQVSRASTSSGLFSEATGIAIEGSLGAHIYVAVADGSDIPRFLAALFDRLWLTGHGFIKLSSVGSMLERSLIDVAVGSPERLVFEGQPVLGPGLQQKRETFAVDGQFIDTKAACPDLSESEKAQVEKLRAAAREAIKPKAAAAQAAWIDAKAPEIASKRGLSKTEIRRQLASSFGGDLEGAFPLVFDDGALGETTVADVVKDPARYIGSTLRDPQEPETEGEACAILLRGSRDRQLFIKSFAHGGRYYFLKGEKSEKGEPAAASEDAVLKAYPLIWEGEPGSSVKTPELVEGMLPETGVALLAGQWGMLKTFTAIDLAVAVTTMSPFAGRLTLRRGGVLFIAAEGSKYLGARLAGAKQEKAATLKDDRLPFAWIRSCPKLTSNDALAHLTAIATAAARRLEERFSLPLALIVIDAMTSAGGFKDANDASEAQRVMDVLNALAEATTTLIVAVDHFGKDVATGTRNSSAKEGGVDAVLALIGDRTTEGAVSNMRLAIRKSRDGETGIQIPFRGRPVELESGGGTLVIEWEATDDTQPQKAKTRWSKSLIIFKRALDFALADAGKRVRPFGMNGPEVLAADREAVRAEFLKTYPGDTPKAKRESFLRCEKDAVARGLIANRDLTVDGRPMTVFWLINENKPA
jgi:hypothetical protein